MNRRLARYLTALYPAAWRSRYADEFSAFLEERSTTIPAVLDVAAAAAREHVLRAEGFEMNTCQQSLTAMTWACLVALVAGANLFFCADDTPLASVMRHQPVLSASFGLVSGAALVAFALVAGLALPITARIVRAGVAARRWDATARLAVPLLAAIAVLAWLASTSLWARATWGRAWVPLPWDVGGDWNAPPGWPPLSVRWLLSVVTVVVFAVGLIASALSLTQAIARTDLAGLAASWFRRAMQSLAFSIIAMTIGAAAWGLAAERYATFDFHARNGGFFLSTDFSSWLGSALLFLASALLALYGARLALRASHDPDLMRSPE